MIVAADTVHQPSSSPLTRLLSQSNEAPLLPASSLVFPLFLQPYTLVILTAAMGILTIVISVSVHLGLHHPNVDPNQDWPFISDGGYIDPERVIFAYGMQSTALFFLLVAFFLFILQRGKIRHISHLPVFSALNPIDDGASYQQSSGLDIANVSCSDRDIDHEERYFCCLFPLLSRKLSEPSRLHNSNLCCFAFGLFTGVALALVGACSESADLTVHNLLALCFFLGLQIYICLVVRLHVHLLQISLHARSEAGGGGVAVAAGMAVSIAVAASQEPSASSDLVSAVPAPVPTAFVTVYVERHCWLTKDASIAMKDGRFWQNLRFARAWLSFQWWFALLLAAVLVPWLVFNIVIVTGNALALIEYWLAFCSFAFLLSMLPSIMDVKVALH